MGLDGEMEGGRDLQALPVSTRGEVVFPVEFTDMRQFLNGIELALQNPWIRMRIQDMISGGRRGGRPSRTGRGGQGGRGRQIWNKVKETSNCLSAGKRSVNMFAGGMCMNAEAGTNRKRMIVVGQVGSFSLKMMLDRGADTSIMYVSQARKLGLSMIHNRICIKGSGAEPIKSIGLAEVAVQIGQAQRRVRFDVVPGSGHPIVGTPDLARMQLVLDSKEAVVIHKPSKSMVKCTTEHTTDGGSVVAAGVSTDQGNTFSEPKHCHDNICRCTHMESLQGDERKAPRKMGADIVQKNA